MESESSNLCNEDIVKCESDLDMEYENDVIPNIAADKDEQRIQVVPNDGGDIYTTEIANNHIDNATEQQSSLVISNVCSYAVDAVTVKSQIEETVDTNSVQLNADKIVVPNNLKDVCAAATTAEEAIEKTDENRSNIKDTTIQENNVHPLLDFTKIFKTSPKANKKNDNNKTGKKKKNNNAQKKHQAKNKKIITKIVLSDNDDDVILLPSEPVPVYIIEDSDDEQKNATDDNSMCDTQCLETNSNLSTDDFLANEDRRRLQIDEDILSLLTHLDDIANVSGNTNVNNNKQSRQRTLAKNLNIENVMENTSTTSSSLLSSTTTTTTTTQTIKITAETTTVNATTNQENNNNNAAQISFEVENTADFRAMDVYDESSESDNETKLQQQKKLEKLTKENSSESNDDSWNAKYRVKRARKYCEPHISTAKVQKQIDLTGNSKPEADNEDNCINKNLDGSITTQVPYIAVGPAVNNRKSSTGEIRRRPRRMSDKRFIATLNNLAQNQVKLVDSSDDTTDYDNDNDADDEHLAKTPTAREIAEKVLAREEHKRKMKNSNTSKAATATTATVVKAAVDAVADVDNDVVVVTSPTVDRDNNANKSTTIASPNALGNEDVLDKLRDLFDRIDNDKPTDEDEEYIRSSDDELINVDGQQNNNNNNSDNQLVRKPYYTYNTRDGYEKMTNDGPGWTYEMSKFYNDAWDNNHMSVENLMNKMSRKKSDWKINTADHLPITRRHKELKCYNCSEFGHTRAKCKKPKKELVCFMCGESGHKEPRCPHTVCLNCGKKSNYFTRSCGGCRNLFDLRCPDCNEYGHTLDMCADKWRRYYETTVNDDEPKFRRYLTYNKRTYCSVCASKNHLAENCRHAKRVLSYPIPTTKIISNVPVYPRAAPQIGLDLKLLYNPEETPVFNMAQQTSSNKYYGRFLKATNLTELMPTNKKNNNNRTTSTHTTTTHTTTSTTTKTTTTRVKNYMDTKNNNEYTTTTTTSAVDFAMDSDSSYSFSENFPLQESQNKKEQEKEKNNMNNTGKIDFGVDFIPFSAFEIDEDNNNYNDQNNDNGDNSNVADNDINARKPLGISNKYQTLYDELKEQEAEAKEAAEAAVEKELPNVAKIFLSIDNSKFLLSPTGQQFLKENALKYNVTTEMSYTSIGHVLHIHGLTKQQDAFHAVILKRLESLMKDKRQCSDIIKNIPKNVSAMITYLRTSIHQLFGKFDDVEYLNECAKFPAQRPTKANIRAADKARRHLNMILIGQAGLNNGREYFQKLIIYLKELLIMNGNFNDPSEVHALSPHMRRDINEIYKMIFTPYYHGDYESLVRQYLALKEKNYLPKLSLDPMLLGPPVVNPPQIHKKKGDKVIEVTDDKKAKAEENMNAEANEVDELQEEQQQQQQQQQQQNQRKSGSNKRKSCEMEQNDELTQNKVNDNKRRCVDNESQQQQHSRNKERTLPDKPPLSKQLEEIMKKQVQEKKNRQQQRQLQAQQQQRQQHNNRDRAQQHRQQSMKSMHVKSHIQDSRPARQTVMSESTTANNKNNNNNNNNNGTNRLNKREQLRNRDIYNQLKQRHQQSRRGSSTPPPSWHKQREQRNRNSYKQQKQQQSQQQQSQQQCQQSQSRRVLTVLPPPRTNLNEPSDFWSKQSITYIEACLPVTVNNKRLHEQIARVLEKSREGCLSYNDYRAVIQLHNTVVI